MPDSPSSPARSRSSIRNIAGWLSSSPVFSRARARWDENRGKFDLPLTRVEKISVGAYLILRDYSQGRFPPRHDDKGITFDNERNQYNIRPGLQIEQSAFGVRRTPFWLVEAGADFIESYAFMLRIMLRCGIQEGHRVLELGCGSAAMSEFLATSGCRCVASSISEFEIANARCRADAFAARKLPGSLDFAVTPMEEVHSHFAGGEPFDFVFVHAALHHAFSWRDCLSAVFRILRPGGWFLICNEPNILHTFVSYRISKLDNTHEIGMSRRAVSRFLRASGYSPVEGFRRGITPGLASIWIAARRPETS